MPTTSERNTHGLDQENTQSGEGSRRTSGWGGVYLAAFMAMVAGLTVLELTKIRGPYLSLGFGLIGFGVCLLMSQVILHFTRRKHGNQDNAENFTDNQEGSNNLRQPLNSTDSREVLSAPTATSSPSVGSRATSSYTFIGGQSSNYPPASSINSISSIYHSSHSLRNPSPFIIRISPVSPSSRNRSPVIQRHSPSAPSSRSHTPPVPVSNRGQTPAGRRQSLRPTSSRSHISVADDPPPYGSVVSDRPWDEPPSYQEASSCLVPREEVFSVSTPNISITSAQNNYLSAVLGRSYLASNRFGSESQSSLP